MEFHKNTVYHIYNQGNNRQPIFFKPENYLFFIRKMREYVLPYGDFLCYCLMPNHFHWLVYVRETELEVPKPGPTPTVGVTQSHADSRAGCADSAPTSPTTVGVTPSHADSRAGRADSAPTSPTTVGVTPSHADSRAGHADSIPIRTLNDSIGILLRSYTRAINKQEDRSGALFREKTKATDGWEADFLPMTHADYGKKLLKWDNYGLTAFQYIHQNPVKARLVACAEDWPYSSAADFAGIRSGTLCNQALARDLLFFR